MKWGIAYFVGLFSRTYYILTDELIFNYTLYRCAKYSEIKMPNTRKLKGQILENIKRKYSL